MEHSPGGGGAGWPHALTPCAAAGHQVHHTLLPRPLQEEAGGEASRGAGVLPEVRPYLHQAEEEEARGEREEQPPLPPAAPASCAATETLAQDAGEASCTGASEH